jgi:hypothetical protein
MPGTRARLVNPFAVIAQPTLSHAEPSGSSSCNWTFAGRLRRFSAKSVSPVTLHKQNQN